MSLPEGTVISRKEHKSHCKEASLRRKMSLSDKESEDSGIATADVRSGNRRSSPSSSASPSRITGSPKDLSPKVLQVCFLLSLLRI